MKKSFNIIAALLLCSLLLFQSLVSTGCFRIMGEVDALNHEVTVPSASEPPSRFFFGSKLNLRLVELLPPAILVTIWELPFELAADVLMLPVDIVILVNYLINPPLGLLIDKHENGRLEQMLKKGADPNGKDLRYHLGYWRPLDIATKARNSKAVQLLLDYGAKLSAEDYFMFHGDDYSNEARDIALIALRTDVPREIAQRNETRFYVNEWIYRWIKKRLDSNAKEEDGQLEFEVISLLLKHGFPVNSFDRDRNNLSTGTTILDDVLSSRRLKPEDKAKMVALLRSYNAQTYSELAQEDPSLPHLDLSEVNVAPQFKPVVEILERSPDAAGYRVSSICPGIAGPLLMFDYLPVKEVKKGKSYTTEIKIHRRISSHEWNQSLETLEVPTYYRIILTPRGDKVPSQIDSAWPRNLVINEQWVTLDTCEMYVALNPERGTHITNYKDLEAIVLTSVPRNVDKYEARRKFTTFEKPIDNSFFNFLLTQRQDAPTRFQTRIDYTLQRANKKTAELGLPGEWHFHSNLIYENHYSRQNEEKIAYFYSSMRPYEELLKTPRPLAPFPNEIIVLAYDTVQEQQVSRPSFNDPFRECLGYWNYSIFGYYSEKTREYANILYGDEVPRERREAIRQVLVELFKCTQ